MGVKSEAESVKEGRFVGVSAGVSAGWVGSVTIVGKMTVGVGSASGENNEQDNKNTETIKIVPTSFISISLKQNGSKIKPAPVQS
jgi:hypothetical protein